MKQIGQLEFKHKSYQVVYNPKTKIASLDPLPGKIILKKYYLTRLVKQLPPFDQQKELKRLQAIEKTIPQGKLLDIGAGPGYFLSVAKKHQWQVYGTEISAAARRWAKKHYQIDLISVNLPQASFKANSFDVITFNAVLEHLPDPATYLQAAYRLLKPNGLLVVRVPNLKSFEFYLSYLFRVKYRGFIIEHLHYFTPEGIKNLLAESGFAVSKMTSCNFSSPGKLRIHPYYLVTNLAKRFLEKTKFGGQLCFGNVLFVYARTEKK